MAHDQVIANFVRGSDLSVLFEDVDVPVGDSIATAVFVIKRDARRDTDAEALVTKNITTTNQPGVGHVTDTGATDQNGEVRVDLDGDADTTLLVAGRAYDFGLKITTAAGVEYQPSTGTIMSRQRVVRA